MVKTIHGASGLMTCRQGRRQMPASSAGQEGHDDGRGLGQNRQCEKGGGGQVVGLAAIRGIGVVGVRQILPECGKREQSAQQILHAGCPGDGLDLERVKGEQHRPRQRRPDAAGEPLENGHDDQGRQDVRQKVGGVKDLGVETDAELVGHVQLRDGGQCGPDAVDQGDVKVGVGFAPETPEALKAGRVEPGVAADEDVVVPEDELKAAHAGEDQ